MWKQIWYAQLIAPCKQFCLIMHVMCNTVVLQQERMIGIKAFCILLYVIR